MIILKHANNYSVRENNGKNVPFVKVEDAILCALAPLHTCTQES